ncbi:MAG: TetR/AcrR family transcriptional regulator [Solirubrobacteraceae bacterium]|nr:TetR/AcrR family transcriptional regulator [Solirubrobacteraceae bacterium]
MARTRPDVAADVKRAAIVEIATRRFSEAGYEDTSMTSLAREAGVSVNTLYWYFENKDALLVAAAEQLRTRRPPGEVTESMSFVDRLVAASNSFDDVGRIVTAVHARMGISPTVGAWHAQYHLHAERILMKQASRHLESAGLPGLGEGALLRLARLWVYALDGIITHGLPQRDRRALCVEMVAQLELAAREGGAPQV